MFVKEALLNLFYVLFFDRTALFSTLVMAAGILLIVFGK